MNDAIMRRLQRRAQEAPHDPEARQALLNAQVRVGQLTEKDAREGLARALHYRFMQRMTSLRAIPLGPFQVGREARSVYGLSYALPSSSQRLFHGVLGERADLAELESDRYRYRSDALVYHEGGRRDTEQVGEVRRLWLRLNPGVESDIFWKSHAGFTVFRVHQYLLSPDNPSAVRYETQIRVRGGEWLHQVLPPRVITGEEMWGIHSAWDDSWLYW